MPMPIQPECLRAPSGLAGQVIGDFENRLNDVLHIAVRHRMEHRQANQLSIRLLSYRELASAISETGAVVRVQVYRDVMDVYPNVLGSQRGEKFAAIARLRDADWV